jgi:transposase InsO family protein
MKAYRPPSQSAREPARFLGVGRNQDRQPVTEQALHLDLTPVAGVSGRKRVERLMPEAGVSGMVRRKRGRTTISVPGVRVADDLVERRFRPTATNVLRVADVTYLRTWEGWLYLAAVQDAYSRAIVG